jgi:ATP-dependent DNA helicase 2 subunit 2
VPEIKRAAEQMVEIISNFIATPSYGGENYQRAAEHLRVMREELIVTDEPNIYNSALRDLKARIAGKKLGGNSHDMWYKHILPGHLNLITQDEVLVADATSEDAKKVSGLPKQTLGLNLTTLP